MQFGVSNFLLCVFVGIMNNYSPKGRWLVVDILYPPLTTDTEVNSCLSIY